MEAAPEKEGPEPLHSSWVEVPPAGQEPPRLACAPCSDMEEILREAQMEAERGDSLLLAWKAPGVVSGSTRQREDPEQPVRMASLTWPWPSPAQPPLPSKEFARVLPACLPLLSPALHRKRGMRDPQFLLLVIPSLLLSHVLALGLG